MRLGCDLKGNAVKERQYGKKGEEDSGKVLGLFWACSGLFGCRAFRVFGHGREISLSGGGAVFKKQIWRQV